MVCQYIGKGNDEHPGIDTVKEEGDNGFAAGAQSEVGAMGESAQRHGQCGNYNKRFGQCFDAFLRIINGREKSSHKDHKEGDPDTGKNTEKNHLVVCIPGFLLLPSTQKLADHNGNTAT